MILILFFILFCVVYLALIDKDLQKYKKSMDKKYNGLVKRMKTLTYNQDTTFDYINDIYNELERFDKYENEEEC